MSLLDVNSLHATEMFDFLPMGIIITDANMRVHWANRYFWEHYSFKDEVLLSASVNNLTFLNGYEILADIHLKQFSAVQKWTGEIICLTSSGENRLCKTTAYPMTDDDQNQDYYLFCFDEVTNSEGAFDDLLKLTRFDQLTGLPKRTYFIETLENKLREVDMNQTFLGVMVIEFDELEHFNALYGQNMDEHLLLELRNSLQTVLGDGLTLARVANAKYALIYEDMSSTNDIEKLAQSVIHLFAEPVVVDSHIIYVDLTIGISLYPTDADCAKILLKEAERVSSSLQKEGTNQYGFSHKLPEKNVDNLLHLSSDLPAAVENGEIYFLFQPQFCHKNKRYSGAELLVRWEHPELGSISPETFIPIAEQTGMIRSVTMKALMEASKMFKEVEELGITDFSLSINISPSMLLYSTFVENVKFFIESYDLAGKQLRFEITENVLTRNLAKMVETLEEIRSMGIGIEMDDYGTGYTSIKYLSQLPIDTLKIDKSFVRDIDKDPKKATLFRAICDMAFALGYEIVAEGVETESEDLIVQTYENIIVQGYYYARPLRDEALLTLLSLDME